MLKVSDDVFKIALLSTAAVICVGSYVFWKQKNKKLRPWQMSIPTRWRKVGEITKINLYPLKSGKYQSLENAECTEVGLKASETPGKHSLVDRSFVLYNKETNDRVTIREYPSLVFVEIKAVDKDTVVFSNPGQPDLTVKIPSAGTSSFVLMWMQEKIDTIDCGEEAENWFTDVLVNNKTSRRICLGYYARNSLPARSTKTMAKLLHAYEKTDEAYLGSYSDLSSYMIMNQSSLDDLNTRLKTPVTANNFRPNFMVKGPKAYEEDDWDWLKIGDEIVMRSFKDCTRCLVTTVDPETGIKNPEQEPLKTLRTYRLSKDPIKKKFNGQSPVMGVNLGIHRTGKVKLGDPVFVNCS